MSKSFNTNTANKDEWLTPPYIIDALAPFDLDPCSPVNRPWETAGEHYTIEDNGLTKPWYGFVWCNPPYGRHTYDWLEKLKRHPEGGIALIFARTDTKGFHRNVFYGATALMFLEGRIRFYDVNGVEGGNPNAPSVLVAYGEEAHSRLVSARRRGLLNGKILAVR